MLNHLTMNLLIVIMQKIPELNMNIVIDSILKLASPLPVNIPLLATDFKAMKFSVNKNCTYPIGNDLIMNYYPTFLGEKAIFKIKALLTFGVEMTH